MSAHHILILLAIGYVLYVADRIQSRIPVPLLLVLIGMGCAYVPVFAEVEITRELLFEGLLPALLFVSAYRLSFSALRRHGAMIGLLSTAGLLLTALLLGGLIWLVQPLAVSLSFAAALTLAAVLTPTDPVSVVGVLRNSDVNPMLVSVIEGESMINDGTSVVVFAIASRLMLEGATFTVGGFAWQFATVSLGGAAIGLVVGWLLAKSIYLTPRKEYQVMLSIIISYGSFYLAEALGASGVLATVAAGIMLAWEFQRSRTEARYRDSLEGFWSVVDPSLTSLVFLIIGIVSVQYIEWTQWPAMLGIFAASLLVRYIVLLLLLGPVGAWRRELSWRGFTVLTMADVRGTMSVVLLLTLTTELPERLSGLLSLAFGVVLCSLVLQSVIVYPLARLVRR
ncbi:cation:proton antiporter [Paenibacillus sp. IB182496]|uniref:Cation:proton antiporter n=1 Tax=Paenibacillus sabuli TaxID=2772509 RepID=A0A927BSF1_9BACL|nr:cation:proton antiporter [Paenibacillus sabuli]MBD2844825.1 cation:proton antiporter [Paenibacillus sabuli]